VRAVGHRHVNIEKGRERAQRGAFMGGLTGVRSMTQPTSQRQQPRYNQAAYLVIRRRTPVSAPPARERAFRSRVEHRSTEHPA